MQFFTVKKLKNPIDSAFHGCYN